MTDRDLFTALHGIDERWILEAAPDEKKQTNSHLWIRWIPVAACLCAIVGLMAAFVVPMLRRERPVVTGVPNSSSAEGSIPNSSVTGSEKESNSASSGTIPGISTAPYIPELPTPLSRLPLVAGNGYAAKDTGFYDQSGNPIGKQTAPPLPPRFEIGAVVEAKVIEVFPDSYYLPSSRIEYRIAKLQILDEINGGGFPEIIYFRYAHYNIYETDLFDGCDSLILSLQQIGIENYLLLNRTKGEYELFPNMFELTNTDDIGYGRLIAFRDGVLDEGFYDWGGLYWDAIRKVLKEAEYHRYPATYGSTIAEVKENIRSLIEEDRQEFAYRRCDYVTAEDLFEGEAASRIPAEVLPGEYNRFEQTLNAHSDQLNIRYTRLVGGFPTEEVIIVRKRSGEPAEVSRKEGVRYTAEDQIAVPDLRCGLEWLKQNWSEIEPEHIAVPENPVYSVCQANGYYRKADGQVCGIIRIIWTYGWTYDGIGKIIQDDCYLLFDSDGNGRLMDRDSLRNLIGEDSLIRDFRYEEYEVPME